MGGIQARFKLDWPGLALDVDLDLPARGVTALFGHSGSGWIARFSGKGQAGRLSLQTCHISGAGEGNRTLVVSLGSFCSAIELRPRGRRLYVSLARLSSHAHGGAS